jgi:hypothetical protein
VAGSDAHGRGGGRVGPAAGLRARCRAGGGVGVPLAGPRPVRHAAAGMVPWGVTRPTHTGIGPRIPRNHATPKNLMHI